MHRKYSEWLEICKSASHNQRIEDIEEFSLIIEHLDEEHDRIVEFFKRRNIPEHDFYPTGPSIISFDETTKTTDVMFICRACGKSHISRDGSKRCLLINRKPRIKRG